MLISALEEGVRRMAGAGFGPARSRCEIMSFESEDRRFTFAPELDVNQLKVVFRSPTELKHDGRLLVEPDFAPLFSLIGSVVYEGALGEFVPYLRVAEWTGVGRQTTWGKGEITVEIPSQGAQQ